MSGGAGPSARLGAGRGFGMGFGRGRGFGGGRGGGRGWRNMYYATGLPGWARAGWTGVAPAAPTQEEELAALKEQAEYFGKALEDIRGRIGELEAKPKDK